MGNLQIDESKLKKIEAIIRSMTIQERNNPKIINGSRRMRIAKGSGTSVQEVNSVLKQFEQMNRMIKQFTDMGRKGKGKFKKGFLFPFGR